LVTLDESYYDKLSDASIATLKHQGGKMSAAELEDFQGSVGANLSIA
jgi:predicted HD phosphohydrolase